MKAAFEGLREKFPKLKQQTTDGGSGVTIYFCGGGFRGYGSMLMHTDTIQPYPIPAIGGYTVPGYRFVQWKKMLEANNDLGKIFGMAKRRRGRSHLCRSLPLAGRLRRPSECQARQAFRSI